MKTKFFLTVLFFLISLSALAQRMGVEFEYLIPVATEENKDFATVAQKIKTRLQEKFLLSQKNYTVEVITPMERKVAIQAWYGNDGFILDTKFNQIVIIPKNPTSDLIDMGNYYARNLQENLKKNAMLDNFFQQLKLVKKSEDPIQQQDSIEKIKKMILTSSMNQDWANLQLEQKPIESNYQLVRLGGKADMTMVNQMITIKGEGIDFSITLKGDVSIKIDTPEQVAVEFVTSPFQYQNSLELDIYKDFTQSLEEIKATTNNSTGMHIHQEIFAKNLTTIAAENNEVELRKGLEKLRAIIRKLSSPQNEQTFLDEMRMLLKERVNQFSGEFDKNSLIKIESLISDYLDNQISWNDFLKNFKNLIGIKYQEINFNSLYHLGTFEYRLFDTPKTALKSQAILKLVSQIYNLEPMQMSGTLCDFRFL